MAAPGPVLVVVVMPLRFLLLVLFFCSRGHGAAAFLASDAQALLQFKEEDLASDSDTVLTTGWRRDSDTTTVCSWTGVLCSSSADSVIGLNFTDLFLNGTLTSSLCLNLPNFTHLYLRYNNFNQSFPYFLLDACPNLIYLDLSENWLYGELPTNISLLSKLQFLSLESNNFVGSIPANFGNLPELRLLRLRGNALSGSIPPELGNLTELQTLDLAWSFVSTPGEIPIELWRLQKLEILSLAGCRFVGTIPAEFSRLHSVTMFDLSSNNLTGTVPSLTNLTAMTQLYLYQNSLSGSLPDLSGDTFANLSDIQIGINSFTGAIPDSYATLPSLRILQLNANKLTGSIPTTFANNRNLQYFVVSSNLLTGNISSDWGLYSLDLVQFDISYNGFTGDLPPNLCHSGTIEYISVQMNAMSGAIPASYATDCQSAVRVRLEGNHFSGSVPAGLWVLPNLDVLTLNANMFSGIIDLSSLSANKSSNLTVLKIDNNQFQGVIPAEIGRYRGLIKFTASGNRLSGGIPAEITRLRQLETLDLSSNAIVGTIPAAFNNCKSLNSLDLSHNHLSGSIPAELASLEILNYLDLSDNSLDGAIPATFGENPKYVSFNVSYNDLSGKVPKDLLEVVGADSFAGNPLLCYAETCYDTAESGGGDGGRNRSRFIGIMAGVVILFCVLLLCGGVAMAMYTKKRLKQRIRESVEWKVITFQKQEFEVEEKIVERLEEKDVIGSGGTGKVYKVSFPAMATTTTVAVKKIDCAAPAPRGSLLSSASRNMTAFTAEMEILGNIKHKNVVKLLCCAMSEDTRLLVYEYIQMGSLGDVLHKHYWAELSRWATRYKIAVGVAEGLSYLHHDCVPYILHRDVKSNNILIDTDLEPKLADFGAAKAMDRRNAGHMTAVVGSIGYIAPEYAYTLKVDEKSDVYSYGVVLLELATGRRPSGGEDVVKWVSKMKEEGEVWRVFDGRIDFGDGDKESMLALLKTALLCTSAMPHWRPSMREALHLLRRAAPLPPPKQASPKCV